MTVKTSDKLPPEPVAINRRSSRKRQATQRIVLSASTSPRSRSTKKARVSAPTTRPAFSKKASKTENEGRIDRSPPRRASNANASRSSQSKGRRTKEPENPKEIEMIDDKGTSNDDLSSKAEEEEDEHSSEEEEQVPEPLYFQGQKVLARDQDGLMYQAFIRRSLFGVNRNKQIQVGMVASQEELQKKLEDNDGDDDDRDHHRPSWHYFVHFLQWKANWDRWVQESDIIPLTPENLALQEAIMAEHRKLQQEFKARKGTTSGRKIDGGAFLKAWRRTLDRLILEKEQKENQAKAAKDPKKSKVTKPSKKKKKSSSLSKAQLKKQIQLRMSEQLMHRQPYEIEQIALSFGLKRVLVEEWEILNSQFDMVHVLPAKTTIRRALDSYLESKEVPTVQDKSISVNVNDTSTTSKNETSLSLKENIDKNENDATPNTNARSAQTNIRDPLKDREESLPSHSQTSGSNNVEREKVGGNEDKRDTTEPICGIDETKDQPEEGDNSTPAMDMDMASNQSGEADLEKVDDSELERRKAWRDMADGICLLFDQSLPFRLLYTGEHSQWAVLEQQVDSSSSTILKPSEIYGCEHLLRLVCQLPALLHGVYRQQPQPNQENQSRDGEMGAASDHEKIEPSGPTNADEEFIKPILAKMNDFCRFLQKNQDDLFVQSYRKKNDAERKYELRLAKRLERKRLASAVVDATICEADSTGSSL